MAVIFYNDDAWLSGRAACFGVRANTQILPAGSVVVGVVTPNQELIEEPFYAPNQAQSWKDALETARAYVRGQNLELATVL